MTRTVAIGAVLGFVATVLAAALWERSAASAAVDAGSTTPVQVAPQFVHGVTAPLDRRVERMLVAPKMYGNFDAGVQ